MDIFDKDLIDWFGEVLPRAPESPVSPLVPSSPEFPASPLVPSSTEYPASLLVPPSSCPPVFPPSLPLPPSLKPVSSSAQDPLVPVSPSAHPQSAPAMHCDTSPQDFQSPAPPRHADPLSPPPASEPWTTLRSSDPLAPPRLLAPPSPPWPIIPPAPLGSLVPPSLLWSVDVHPPPRHSTPLARSGSSFPPSSFPPVPPSSSVAPALPRSSGFPPTPEPSAPPRPSESSVLPRLYVCSVSNSSGSVSVSRPPGVVGPFSTMAPLAVISTVGCHPGWPLDCHLAPPAPGSSLAPPTLHSPHGLIFWAVFVAAPFLLPAPHLLLARLLNPHPPSSVGPLSAWGLAGPGGGEILHVDLV